MFDEIGKVKLAAFDDQLEKQAMHPGLKAGGVLGALMAALGHGDTSLLGALMAGGSLAGAGVEAAAGEAVKDVKDAKNFASSQYKSLKKTLSPGEKELKEIKKEAFIKQFNEKTAAMGFFSKPFGRFMGALGTTAAGAAIAPFAPYVGLPMMAGGTLWGTGEAAASAIRGGMPGAAKQLKQDITGKLNGPGIGEYIGRWLGITPANKKPQNFSLVQQHNDILDRLKNRPDAFGQHSEAYRQLAGAFDPKTGKLNQNFVQSVGGLQQALNNAKNNPFSDDVAAVITNHNRVFNSKNLAHDILTQGLGMKEVLDPATGQLIDYKAGDLGKYLSKVNPATLNGSQIANYAKANPGYAAAGIGLGALGMYGAGKALFGNNGDGNGKKKGNVTIVQ